MVISSPLVRWRSAIVASALVLLSFGCMPKKDKPPADDIDKKTLVTPAPEILDVKPPQSCIDSGLGQTEKKNPIVCLDDRNFDSTRMFTINPDPIAAYRTHNGNHIKIAWVTASGGRTVDVIPKDDGCVDLSSKRLYTGGCTIKTATGSGHKECKYSVTIDGVLVDPVVIIDDNPVDP